MNYKISLLDQSPVLNQESNEATLARTVKLAQGAEKLGYHRFLVSEHHNSSEVAGSSPEVLVSYLLAKTEKIRIGSGGVMLQHYSPYKVAENFNVLASLAGDRVDLGIGKAPGGLPLSTKALQYKKFSTENDFYERLSLLNQFINNTVPENHEFAELKAAPIPKVKPEIILLGASRGSAEDAAKLGISFAYAQFFNSNDEELEAAVKAYREHFPTGRFILGVNVIASIDEEKAKDFAAGQTLYKVHLASGKRLTLVTEEQAEKLGRESGESFTIEKHEPNVISGTPVQIKEKLDELHTKYGVDEFIYHTPVLNEEVRNESFQLISPTNLEKLGIPLKI
ncbi:LLM class flavin-dependent oxidoreductase [Ureibacillus acetophenoni]|uniref:Luciferase family oxidoreductase group 1 n=1 Tax=Ureibacillus acetophenoni TaxID=614649 RepID=A0A285UGE1_9BACL|nr:LLM class flavin-dependent oxidoreductase [Ureibacillus acetophenoni]SOC40737.1 luciferase family oxidoreductase group 1 [Ureibacillus acetophenoni]